MRNWAVAKAMSASEPFFAATLPLLAAWALPWLGPPDPLVVTVTSREHR